MYARDSAPIATPIGGIRISGGEAQIASIQIETGDTVPIKPSGAAIARAADQLEAWFAGELTGFDLPLAPSPTPCGAALRDGMIAIPFVNTMSYGTLARALTSSPRAISQACVRNPFPIVVPCHRVLNSGGSLGAYSAGDGPGTKLWLLEHERRHTGGPS